MASNSSAQAPNVQKAHLDNPLPTGRLTVLSAFVMAANAVPIPLLPDAVVARVRGAIAHDTAARHGLGLTADARTVLSSVDAENRAIARRAGETVIREVLKRLGPLAVVGTVSRGVEAYALGLLFNRYIERVRASAQVRIDVDEARRVRDAIDRAVLRVLSPALKPETTTMSRGSEDLRTETTRWVDTMILTGASLPGYLERRLEAAFDEIAAETPELRNG